MPHVYIEVWTPYPWRDGQASQQLRDLSATHTVQEEKADLPEDLAWDMSNRVNEIGSFGYMFGWWEMASPILNWRELESSGAL